MRSFLENIISAALWTVILTTLPFIKSSIDASETASDSWQRGLVLMPFVFLVALLAAHSISKWAISRGYTSYLGFTFHTSSMSAAISILVIIPFSVVAGMVGLVNWSESLLLTVYGIGLVFVTCIPAASLWWLIRGVAHNKSSESDAGKFCGASR